MDHNFIALFSTYKSGNPVVEFIFQPLFSYLLNFIIIFFSLTSLYASRYVKFLL